MYLRTTKRKNKDGSVVEYYQLAHNNRHAKTGKSSADIIHNFGRADELDRGDLVRLCRSIAKVCGLDVRDPMDPSDVNPARSARPPVLSEDFQLCQSLVHENGNFIDLRESNHDIVKRRQIEEDPAQLEEEFLRNFDPAPLGVAIAGTDFRFRLVNPKLCEITGYSREELLSRTFIDITHPDHIAKDAAAMQCIMVGEADRYQAEKRCIRKDGAVIWVTFSSRLALTRDGAPSHLVAYFEDISERKEVQRVLQETKDRFSFALKASGAAMWSWNQNERRLAWQDSPYPLFHLTSEQMETFEISTNNAVHPDDRERVARVFSKFAREGGQYEVECRVIWPDGSIRDILTRGQTYIGGKERQVIGFAIDITEFKRVENELQKSKALLSTIIESIPFELWVLDQDGRYMHINPVSMKHYGNLLGKKLDDVGIDLENLSLWQEKFRKAFGGEVVDEEAEIKYPGMGVYHTIIAPIRDGDRIMGIVGVNIDISERKQMEVELRKSRDKLESQVKERTKQLDERNRRLEEFNAALKILLKQREEDKKDLEESVLSNVKDLILPYVEKLKNSRLDADQMTYLDILESHIEEIISPFSKVLSAKYMGLTPAELQTADLIRGGKTTQEIAKLLGISDNTVSTHRFNLRKKLKLTNKAANLRIHLRSLG